jgi:hypothetical protein
MRLLQVVRHPSNVGEVAIAIQPPHNQKNNKQPPVRGFAQAAPDSDWHEITEQGAKLSTGGVYPTRKGLGLALENLYQAWLLGRDDAQAEAKAEEEQPTDVPAAAPLAQPAQQGSPQQAPGSAGAIALLAGALGMGTSPASPSGPAGGSMRGAVVAPSPSFSLPMPKKPAALPKVLPSASLPPGEDPERDIAAADDVFANDLAELEAHLNDSRARAGGL